MNYTIYYYSATGNSLHAAKSLGRQLHNCRLLSMPSFRGAEEVKIDTDGVGFVFPTHYFGLPPLVIEFIKKLNLDKMKYSFAAATCGSRYITSVLHQLDLLLRQKNKGLDAVKRFILSIIFK